MGIYKYMSDSFVTHRYIYCVIINYEDTRSMKLNKIMKNYQPFESSGFQHTFWSCFPDNLDNAIVVILHYGVGRTSPLNLFLVKC